MTRQRVCVNSHDGLQLCPVVSHSQFISISHISQLHYPPFLHWNTHIWYCGQYFKPQSIAETVATTQQLIQHTVCLHKDKPRHLVFILEVCYCARVVNRRFSKTMCLIYCGWSLSISKEDFTTLGSQYVGDCERKPSLKGDLALIGGDWQSVVRLTFVPLSFAVLYIHHTLNTSKNIGFKKKKSLFLQH